MSIDETKKERIARLRAEAGAWTTVKLRFEDFEWLLRQAEDLDFLTEGTRDAEDDKAFAEEWSKYVRAGFQYGEDALRTLRFGFGIAMDRVRQQALDGFYLASFKDGRSRGTVTWWGPGNSGYTPYLEQAGVYRLSELRPGYHDSDYTVPVPVGFLRGKAVRVVDTGHEVGKDFVSAEALREAIAKYRAGGYHG